MEEFHAQTFFKEGQKLLQKIDYEKKLFSLECILAFERKWQGQYANIKLAATSVQAIYTDILIMYVVLSDDLDPEEEVAYDAILENYSDIALINSG